MRTLNRLKLDRLPELGAQDKLKAGLTGFEQQEEFQAGRGIS